MALISIVHALKVLSLKLFIHLLDARKVCFALLQRMLIAFSIFCKHSATTLRLQRELRIEFLSLLRYGHGLSR